MKLALANVVRSNYTAQILNYLTEAGEDVALIASNKVNFPTVLDEEECFVEVAISVVKKPSDECYQEREDYIRHCAEVAEKKAAKAKEAEEKKAKAEAKKEKKE